MLAFSLMKEGFSMTRFVVGDRVRRTELRDCTGTVVEIQGQNISVDFDNKGGRACLPFDKLELEAPDSSREEPPSAVRRRPYGH
jgi:hypothetical protein